MTQESLQRIDSFLESSTQDLFKSQGMEVTQDPRRKAEAANPLAATIGFTSENLRGFLMLTLDRDLASRSLPPNLREGAASEEILADWTGELSNQLLGRLKGRFCPAGIEISLSTPIVFTGKEMHRFPNTAPIQRTLFFAEGRLIVEIQASYDRDFEIPEESERSEPGRPEGEVLFF
jgi:CheY-specific phosphatase CheX